MLARAVIKNHKELTDPRSWPFMLLGAEEAAEKNELTGCVQNLMLYASIEELVDWEASASY